MTTQEQTALESLIDTYGLFAVLDALSGICGGKSEHVAVNWQDKPLAEAWEKAEAALDKTASVVLDLDI